ncbi:hypothetical protein D9756_008447 [Leucocoprinus leucothites]|uniref:protein-histidine N-methyltransferase n=1 Tax=Leucocoprinus leucothites TaxID=201217 RepID=A0A8H5D1X6_9AGAR|nr:hypothetical protein D9756_008447 [Leucoagaricus leucothites]
MFKFDFDIDDLVDDPELSVPQIQPRPSSDNQKTAGQEKLPTEAPCREIPIHDLLDSLPSLISCSPLTIPLHGGTKNVTLVRRDLFDARFQLIAEGAGPDDATNSHTAGATKVDEDAGAEEKQHRHVSALQFIEAPSDLVPRVYEGGLKTWECSIDLVEYLDSTQGAEGFRGKRILELGCGTAVPSLYILHHIFSSPPTSDGSQTPETLIYLQDYNDSVLELVTLPNVLLTWYLSPASQTYRTSNATSTDNAEDLPFPTTPEPFELPISPSLKSAFLSSVKKTYNITIRFFSGSWSSFSTQLPNFHPEKFDIVLTSETIYRMNSLPSLVETMRLACCGSRAEEEHNSKDIVKAKGECLVATKVLYFGVGGGVSDFVDFVEKKGIARTKTEKDRKTGVGRVVLSLDFI